MTLSTRAQIITRRTYNRPLNEEGTVFETWTQTIDRVISHQRWLWERALTHKSIPEMPLHDITEDMLEWVHLGTREEAELEELRQLMLDRKVCVAGRCFTGDTKVKLLDGTTPRFDELEIGKTYWAYGSTMKGKVVPVEAINNGITRKDTSYARITLDNDEVIKCTIDHPFLTRDGQYILAKDLKPNQSLMPLYTRLNRHGYEEVKDNSTGTWTSTHKLVAQDQKLEIPEFDINQFLVLHHKNFDKYNNVPSNLEYMGDRDHFDLHSKLGKENAKKMNDLIWHHPDYEDFRKAKASQCREMALDFWSNPKYEDSRKVVIRKSSERAVERNKTEEQKKALKAFRSTEEGTKVSLTNLQKANEGYRGIKVKLFKLAKALLDKGLEITKENWDANKPFKGAMGITNIDKYFGSYAIFRKELTEYNHSVKSVEIITVDTPIDFYDFSVPRTVNFALASGVFVHNTLWLGGTPIGKRVELSQFNCAFIKVTTVHDMVDLFWGLLNGAGVTALPDVGTLTGFRRVIPNLKIIRTTRKPNDKGPENNQEYWEPNTNTWTIKVGDSARAWAKSIGKLLACKYPASTLVLDFSQIRGPGARLRNYGWLSQSDTGLSVAYTKIFEILNSKADALLTEIDIGDIINLLGTVLSTRRAAEALLMSRENPRWKEFINLKASIKENNKTHRYQSNNSLLFYHKPTYQELTNIFDMLNKGGNGEPGFVNAQHMLQRAPWAKGLNPSLRAGTKVFSDIGIVPIESLVDKEFKVFTINNRIAEAACRLSGKNKQLFKITLEGGHEYYATKEHSWPVYRHTKRDIWSTEPIKYTTEELLPGDALINILRDYLYPEAVKGTYNEGFFLGWLLGDGWITIREDNNYHQIGLILSDEDYNSPIKDKLLEQMALWGSQATFRKSSNNAKSWELNTQNKTLWEHISNYGVVNKEHLPTSIFSAEYSEEYRKGFIDATFSSDGTVEKTSSGYHIRIGVTTSLRSRHNELVELLGFYGIKTSVQHTLKEGTFPNGKDYNKLYEAHILRFSSAESLEHFNKLFKLSQPRKQELIISSISKYFDEVKRHMLGKIRIESVVPTDIYEDVYDIGVYDFSHTFQLAHGITGNCFEILLPDGGTCNLVTIDLAKFKNDTEGLLKAAVIITRANYRQTIVDFNDGILQEKWNLNNNHLHLCGISSLGIAMRPDMLAYDYKRLERTITHAGYSMAEELDTPYPKNLTALKPEGTISKCFDSSEGVHTPLGKYIFNNVSFGVYDPLIPILKAAGYKTFTHPTDNAAIIITLPVKYEDVVFTEVNGVELNLESAVTQLERYKMLMHNYCHQNVSCTISYSLEETKEIVDWLYNNWDSYVAVSFLFRNDHTKTAEDLGYAYLPQQVVTKAVYDEYISKLLPVDLDSGISLDVLQDDCATGACPIR